MQGFSLEIATKGENKTINAQEILYLCARNRGVLVVTADEELWVKSTYKEVKEKLSSAGFFEESCRGFLVNLYAVQRITQDSLLCCMHDVSGEVPLARRRRKTMKEKTAFVKR